MSLFLDNNKKPCAKPAYNGYALVSGHSLNTTTIFDGDKSYSYTGCEQQFIYRDGQCVFVDVMVIGNNVWYYVKLDKCDRYISKVTGKIGGTLTGNLSTYMYMHKASKYDELVASIQQRIDAAVGTKYDVCNFTYKYSLKKEKYKITQFHHMHVRLKDLYKNADYVIVKGLEAVLCCYLDRFNNIETTHATFITYFRSLDDRHKMLFYALMRTYGCIDKEWLKREGTRAKQCQHYTSYDLSKIFELNVLENRVSTEVDWNLEKQHRVKPQLAEFSYGDIYAQCVNLFGIARGEGKIPMKMRWADYWAQRAVIMPAGAVHSTYEDDKVIIKGLPQQAKNKKGFSSVLPEYPQSHYLNRYKKIESYTSTKYEWGKTRALYGCDYTSHVNADYGLMNCEDTFPSFIPTGSSATEENVEKVLKPMKGVPFCYDYDDFNSQHSVSSMQAVIDAWLHVYADKITAEQRDAAIWTRDSIQNMYVNNLQQQTRYKATGTLFSGWRLTTFINTALNYAYLAKAGISKQVTSSIHNGDDVYASARSLGSALKVIEDAACYGVRAQKTKMNIGTIAEFLRMDLRSKKHSTRQYLTRSTATFVHSRVESDAPFSLRQLVSAYYNRYNEMIERGAVKKLIYKLYRKQLWFAARLFNVDKSIIDDLTTMDITVGGVVKRGRFAKYRLVDKAIDIDSTVKDVIKTRIRNGATSYTTYLMSKFPTIKRAFSLKTVESNLLSMYNIAKTTVVREDVNTETMYNERALKGAWTNLPGMTVIHKMRMGISNIVFAISYVSPELASVLEKSGDPIKWMRILL